MAIGTMLGGWRIVKTMGSRITPHLHPMGDFSAELAAATTIGLATIASVPISTTQATGGAVSGVGATRGAHAVRSIWGQRIVWAWILTFPGAAIIGLLPRAFRTPAIHQSIAKKNLPCFESGKRTTPPRFLSKNQTS
jgi:PiT family inorganic phosphate transporter